MDLTNEIANALLAPNAFVTKVIDFATTRLQLDGPVELALIVEVANGELPGTHLEMLRFPLHLVADLADQLARHHEHMTGSEGT